MKRPIRSLVAPLSLLLGAVGCNGLTATTKTLPIQTAPDFSARVVSITHEQGLSPAGPYAQYDLLVTIPPSDTANAGLVLSDSMPVFESVSGGYAQVTAKVIQVGQTVNVWHDFRVAYGASQGPPGGPTYEPTQVVLIP